MRKKDTMLSPYFDYSDIRETIEEIRANVPEEKEKEQHSRIERIFHSKDMGKGCFVLALFENDIRTEHVVLNSDQHKKRLYYAFTLGEDIRLYNTGIDYRFTLTEYAGYGEMIEDITQKNREGKK